MNALFKKIIILNNWPQYKYAFICGRHTCVASLKNMNMFFKEKIIILNNYSQNKYALILRTPY